MGLVRVGRGSITEAAEVLAQVMQDEPEGRFILPDPTERLAIQRAGYLALLEWAVEEGRVDAWGDPIVAVAVWLRRPAIGGPPRPRPEARPAGPAYPPDAVERRDRFAAVMQQLRAIARPEPHAYLDTLATLVGHRRQGIASTLLEAGHAWADAERLPCALDALTDENVSYYGRRRYRVVAAADVPGSELRITAMRRDLGSATSSSRR